MVDDIAVTVPGGARQCVECRGDLWLKNKWSNWPNICKYNRDPISREWLV